MMFSRRVLFTPLRKAFALRRLLRTLCRMVFLLNGWPAVAGVLAHCLLDIYVPSDTNLGFLGGVWQGLGGPVAPPLGLLLRP